ncbi:MAG TPA: ATP-binding protein [Candidatus Saccharimonadales bacterium]|jgi:predicted kinase|nr:ATP-binding protein [Candidatus Saccharimonadales bacterium]
MKSLSLNRPHMIIMVGLPGSGKSFFAENFAQTFNAPFISLEKIIPFTTNNSAALALMQHHTDEILKTNRSIIIEGGASTRVEREALVRKAKVAGYDTLIVWVQTDPATAKIRSVRDSKNKINRTLSADEYDRIVKRFTPPNNLEKPTVISGKHTYATQAKIVLKKLSAARAEISTHPKAPVRTEERSRRSNIIVR